MFRFDFGSYSSFFHLFFFSYILFDMFHIFKENDLLKIAYHKLYPILDENHINKSKHKKRVE